MKRQNNIITKNGIMSIAISILFVIEIASPMLVNANAITANDTIIPSDVASDIIKKNPPTKLTAIDLEQLKNIATSDQNVKKLIDGKPFEFMSQGFLGNVRTIPIVYYPVIQINVNNKTDIAVKVDLHKRTVMDIQVTPLHKSMPMTQTSTSAAFAQDYYSGSHSIAGLYDTEVAPTFTGIPKVFWLVNGAESTASDANLCTSSLYYNNYWAQAGLDFYDKFPMYTDTSHSCNVVNAMISYVAGHPYFFEIYSNSGSFNWTIVDLDQQTGLFYQYNGPTVASNSLKTNDVNTSVWFENQMTTTNWASDFSSAITASNARIKDYSSQSWINWDAETKSVTDCSGVNQGNPSVMTGGLINNGQTTWDLTKLQVYHC